MDGSIALDDQLRFATIKVRDVITKLMLSSEFELEQLSISERLHSNPSADVCFFRSSRASSARPAN
jgi:hypothetical protein